jgi:hypothetical protein
VEGGIMNELFPAAAVAESDNIAAIPTTLCEQCGQAFKPRSGSGGKPQRFCSQDCRTAFHNNEPQRSQRSPTCSASTVLPAVIPPAPKAAPAPTEKDFAWSADQEDIVLREQPSIAIYRNPYDGIVIRQERRWDEDDDTFIVINRENIDTFLDRLTDIAGVLSFGGPEPKSGKRT